ADGYTDVAVGVVGPTGPVLLIYDGARGSLSGEAMSFTLPAEASAVEFGALDNDPFMDLAVAAGSEIELVHGWGRKSSPSLESRVERLSTSFNVQGMALGNFIWDRNNRTEIAALGEDGTINLIERSKLDTRPFNDEELAARAASRGNPIVKQSTDDVDAAPAWQPGSVGSWNAPKQLSVSLAATYGQQSRLVRSSLYGHGTDTLIALNKAQNRLEVIEQSDSQTAVAAGS